MARDDFGNRGRDGDDRHGQDIGRDRERGAGGDAYAGPPDGRGRDASRERYASTGDERDVGYGGDRGVRDAPYGTSGRAGIGGGMGREGGGRYAGRPEDDARAMRYDRDDYDDGADREGLRGGRGEGRGRDASFDRDDARHDAYGAEGMLRDRHRGGTMGAGMGGNAGWREASGAPGGLDRGERERYERWREASYREAHEREPYYRSASQRGAEHEYGAGYAHEYGRQGGYGPGGGGIAGRPGGAGDVRGASAGRAYGAASDRPDMRRDLLDRNPGQGFGAFGWSNADERGDRIPPAAAAGVGSGVGARERDFTGRGPRGYRRSDERIREDVCERLTMHREIDASDVDIDVRDGVVTLTGKVEDKHAKRLAEDVAEEVMGVVDVRNELRTARRGFLGALFDHDDRDDRDAARGQERELPRDTSREVDRTTARLAAERAETRAEVDAIGVATTGPTGAAGTAGVRRTKDVSSTAGTAGAAGAADATDATARDQR